MRKIQHKQHHVRLALFVLIVGAFLFWAYGYFSNQIVYPATTLHDGKSYLDGAWQQEAKKNLTETQKLYETYNASTSVFTRVGTLTRIYGYQDSLGLYLDAKKTLESILALQTSSNTLRTYALLLWKMWAPKEAMEAIDQAITLTPTLPDLWNTKIDFLRVLYKNNLKYLEPTYRDALKKTQDNIDIVGGYAHYLEQMGKKTESIKYYKKAIDMNLQGKYEYQDAINRQQ